MTTDWRVRLLMAIAAVFTLFLLPTTAQAEVKAIILAATYDKAEDRSLRLANTVVDARNIRTALREAGVNQIRLVEEPTMQTWERELQSFTDSLRPDDVAFVYYAGHGFQIDGKNYFLTADGQHLMEVDQLLQWVSSSSKGSVFMIDACRNNPYATNDAPITLQIVNATRGARRSIADIPVSALAKGGGGLAQLGDLRGLSAVVMFSTEPGNVAEDGPPGRGSPFANAATTELRKRQSLDRTMRQIALKVNKDTAGRQSPWRQGDLAFDVYLAGMRSFPTP